MSTSREYLIEFEHADGTLDAITQSFPKPPDPVMIGGELERRGYDLNSVFHIRAKLVRDGSYIPESMPYEPGRATAKPAIIILALVVAATLLALAVIF